MLIGIRRRLIAAALAAALAVPLATAAPPPQAVVYGSTVPKRFKVTVAGRCFPTSTYGHLRLVAVHRDQRL